MGPYTSPHMTLTKYSFSTWHLTQKTNVMFLASQSCFSNLPLQINIRAGGSIDSIQMFYGGKPGGHHGGLVGAKKDFRVQSEREKLCRAAIYIGCDYSLVTGLSGSPDELDLDQAQVGVYCDQVKCNFWTFLLCLQFLALTGALYITV